MCRVPDATCGTPAPNTDTLLFASPPAAPVCSQPLSRNPGSGHTQIAMHLAARELVYWARRSNFTSLLRSPACRGWSAPAAVGMHAVRVERQAVARQQQVWRRSRAVSRAALPEPEANRQEDHGDDAMDDIIAAPRMEAGLDIHRRAHVSAIRHPAYLYQWRAFCERQSMEWRNYSTDEDEGFLAGA